MCLVALNQIIFIEELISYQQVNWSPLKLEGQRGGNDSTMTRSNRNTPVIMKNRTQNVRKDAFFLSTWDRVS